MITIIYIAIALYIANALFQIFLGILEIAYGLLLLLFAGVLQIIIVVLDLYYFFWDAVTGK